MAMHVLNHWNDYLNNQIPNVYFNFRLCAEDYEKYDEMALAALAYKCMEVAFMKVVFLKHSAASKDQQDLKRFLGLITSGKLN